MWDNYPFSDDWKDKSLSIDNRMRFIVKEKELKFLLKSKCFFARKFQFGCSVQSKNGKYKTLADYLKDKIC